MHPPPTPSHLEEGAGHARGPGGEVGLVPPARPHPQAGEVGVEARRAVHRARARRPPEVHHVGAGPRPEEAPQAPEAAITAAGLRGWVQGLTRIVVGVVGEGVGVDTEEESVSGVAGGGEVVEGGEEGGGGQAAAVAVHRRHYIPVDEEGYGTGVQLTECAEKYTHSSQREKTVREGDGGMGMGEGKNFVWVGGGGEGVKVRARKT
jgi:hypothetical protein